MTGIFSGVHHVNVQTNDMQKSVQFYTEVLGFVIVSQREIGDIKLVNLRLGASIIELKETGEEPISRDGVIDHLAIRVSDIHAALELIKKQGMELITAEPKAIGKNEYILFFRGPAGEKIELIND